MDPIPADAQGVDGLTRDIASCTTADDRLFMWTYEPGVFSYAERLFAGGLEYVHAGRFSSPADRAFVIARLGQQSVPVAVVEAETSVTGGDYPDIGAYFLSKYERVATLGFGDDRRHFQIFVDRQRPPAALDPRWSLPCFR